METKRVPAEVFSLAEYLCDEMQERGWTTIDVALRMGVEGNRNFGIDKLTMDFLLAVQKEKIIIGDDLFQGLALAFGVSEKLFRGLHSYWLENPDRRVEFECPEAIFGE